MHGETKDRRVSTWYEKDWNPDQLKSKAHPLSLYTICLKDHGYVPLQLIWYLDLCLSPRITKPLN